MDTLDRLHDNLTSGASYMTQESNDPHITGQIIYDNIVATCKMLYGDDFTDDNVEYVIDAFGAGVGGEYWTRRFSAAKAAREIDARAKANGGKGWL